MECLLPWRALRRSAPAVLVSALLGSAAPARAADEFAVTAAQIGSLGVTLQRLEQPAEIKGQAYPARVVLPPAQEQIVSAPLAGLVDRLLVGENDIVRTGQPLLRLVSPELGELQLKLLEAASKSRLAQKAAQRERQLFAEGIIPERRVQEADAAAEETRARVRQAEAALMLVGFDSSSIRSIGGGGALRDALTVHAKAAGTVLALNVKPGQRVAQADALMRLADTTQLWLDIQVPADRRSQLSPKGGRPITIVGRDATALAINAGSLVSDSQTVTLRARVTQGADRLRPGEYVQAHVPFTSGSDGVGWAVPVQSVVRQGDKAYVFVRTPKGFMAQQVTVTNSAGQSVQVQGPLKSGQEIATGSVIALKAAWLGKGGSN